ncbi:MurR/RpiR family transcriptional regulator [Deinococcus irradiatisoli]|uniref:MurR/RpiR family transcriptional regulator n=1 Tax=Deinococcus irradiatisoli TaxID=2202254 RepID=A0A2Z3JGH3_9DEIO|nr:MurR/RpiR family transcriptional regulator [Deinococcus irradiatisoli]AWN22029.1 MurR/RpiR family transcriptional regulator [Deinococcus irradiatisoli]
MTRTLAPRSSVPGGALGRIRLQADNLSPSLRRVADHVLQDADNVVHQTITELATNVGVGEATITRLCRKLDFAGFHAFKIALAADVLGRESQTPPPDGSLKAQASHLARQTAQTLEDTAQLLDPDVLEQVADRLARAPRVDLTGQGNSGLLAVYFAHRLMRIGITAVVHADPHMAAVAISSVPRGGVVIGLSSSGSTIDTVQHLKLAQAQGHFTVALTHRARSPVTRYASAVLFTSTQEDPLSDSVLGTLTSQVLTLEMLYRAVLSRRPEAHAMLRVTAESVAEKKY